MATNKPTGISLIVTLLGFAGFWNILVGAGLVISSSFLSSINIIDLTGLGILAGILIAIFGLLQLATAIGVYTNESWAKPAVILLAVIGLFSIPVGTILSIIIIALLFNKEVDNYW